MIKFNLNRRGDIPSTLTWMIAFIIIFFLMFFLVLIVSLMRISPFGKSLQISVEFSGSREAKGDFALTQELIAFLKTPVNGRETISDIVLKAGLNEGEDERIKKFKEAGKKFMDENFPNEEGYFRKWMRVYEFDEKIGQYGGHFTKYTVSASYRGESGGIYCEPYLIDTTFIVIYLSDKKIALCANHEHE